MSDKDSIKSKEEELFGNVIETINGTRKVRLKNKSGEEVEITLHEVPYLEADKLQVVWGDFKGELELFTGMKAEDIIRDFDNHGQVFLHREGRDLNFFTYQSYLEEFKKTNQMLGGNQDDVIYRVMKEYMDKDLKKKED